MFFAPFLVLLCSARPCQSSCTLQPLKVSTHHARPYIVFIWFAHLCSPYTIKSARVSPIFCHPCSPLILRAPLQSPFAPQPQESPPCHTTLCSLNSSRKPLQPSYEQKQKSLRLLFCACSLHSYKIPLQSPYIAPTLKVPPHRARLSVSIGSVFLCGLGVTFAPLRLALTIGERAVSGSI